MEITRTIDTTAAVDSVYDYLSDFTTTNDWDPGTVETRRIAGTGGVGTEYHNTSKFLGRETELIYTTMELKPSQLVRLEGNNKTVRATDTMELTAMPSGGTRVVYNAKFDFKGLAGKVVPLMKPVLAPAFKKLGDEAEVAMKRALDGL